MALSGSAVGALAPFFGAAQGRHRHENNHRRIARLAGASEADVFVSVDATGNYVLSNVHRPGRTYERVIRVPQSSLVSLDQQPQMIAAQPYAELVSAAATAHQLPAALSHAVIQTESSYNSLSSSAATSKDVRV